jgi:hypothetical protein
MKNMSSAYDPVLAVTFGAPILAYALVSEGCEVVGDLALSLSKETEAFLTRGSTLGKNALKDLSTGLTGNLIHGVKDGGTVFGAMVGGVEVIFQRCGQTIIGIYANDENECVSAEIAENISNRYADILNEIKKISTATDKEMTSHIEKMDRIKHNLALATAENERISDEINQLKQNEKEMLFELEKSNNELEMYEGSEIQKNINSMIASMNESLEAMRTEISANNIKLLDSENSKVEQAENLNQEKEVLEEMEQRQKEGERILELHDARMKEHVRTEIQRITTTDNPFDHSDISLYEDENGNTFVRVEETD